MWYLSVKFHYVIIIYVLYQVSHVVLPFPSVKYFCQQVRTILTCLDVCCQWLTHRDTLYHSMVEYWVTIFTHSTLRSLGVVYKRHVVSIDVWGSFDRNTHHPQLVSEPTECFRPVFHRHKLCTKKWCFNCRLLLGHPLNQSCVHKNKEPSPWLTCCFVSGMVAVDVHPQVYDFAPRLWHISWYRLLYVAIKWNPLLRLKAVMVYLCLSRIKRQHWVVLWPKVQENVEDHFQMSLPWQHQIWSQHQKLCVNVYLPEFNYPLQYTNNWLVVRSQLWFKLGLHVLGGFIPDWEWVHHCLWYLPKLPEIFLHVCFNILYCFLYVLRRYQWPCHDTIQKFHQLQPCTQVDIWVSQRTRFQTKLFIHLFEEFSWVIPNCKNVVSINKYVLVVLESVALSCLWYHQHIGVSKARLVSHLFHTINQMITERCTGTFKPVQFPKNHSQLSFVR